MAVAADETAYCVGDNGCMVVGRHGMWRKIDTGTDFNLMDVCIHEETVYVCSDFQVFRWVEAELVPDFGDDAEDSPDTCLRLVSGGGSGLFSIGPYDVFVRKNGVWRRLA